MTPMSSSGSREARPMRGLAVEAFTSLHLLQVTLTWPPGLLVLLVHAGDISLTPRCKMGLKSHCRTPDSSSSSSSSCLFPLLFVLPPTPLRSDLYATLFNLSNRSSLLGPLDVSPLVTQIIHSPAVPDLMRMCAYARYQPNSVSPPPGRHVLPRRSSVTAATSSFMLSGSVDVQARFGDSVTKKAVASTPLRRHRGV
ncbi:hypothetical protein EYF80_024032 [Liparis tanakae]|uniref:Uncharacterized protein n=1 Tax=Liparis tanakae TaxID=230148 RepID=A0A4Z2HIJ5_9TELE|nr:hypothetical protein EYF80_024032 [Liparis tanakae]